MCSVVQISSICSELFFDMFRVDMSSPATCTAVEVMLDVHSHLIIDFKLISPF
jgi:hypothetical protein